MVADLMELFLSVSSMTTSFISRSGQTVGVTWVVRSRAMTVPFSFDWAKQTCANRHTQTQRTVALRMGRGYTTPGTHACLSWAAAQPSSAMSQCLLRRALLCAMPAPGVLATLNGAAPNISFAVPARLPETLRGDAESQFLGSAWLRPGRAR
jgi:hypothetical protein